MKQKNLYILGVGRNTIVTIDLAESCGYSIAGLYHYEDGCTGNLYFGHRIIGSNKDLFESDLHNRYFAISVGDNHIRSSLYNEITIRGGDVVTLIHPEAYVSKYARVGRGCCIEAGSSVCASAVIGDDCVVSSNATVVHGAEMRNHSFLAPASVLGANVVFEEFAFLGLNATVISNKVSRVGKNACIGAGAVVTKSVKDDAIMAGNPARILE